MEVITTNAELLKQKVNNCVKFLQVMMERELAELITREKENMDPMFLAAMAAAPAAFAQQMTMITNLAPNLIFSRIQSMFLDTLVNSPVLIEQLMDQEIADLDFFSRLMCTVPGVPVNMNNIAPEELAKCRAYGRCFFELTLNDLPGAKELAARQKEKLAISTPVATIPSFDQLPQLESSAPTSE